jgi:hypothetical protein
MTFSSHERKLEAQYSLGMNTMYIFLTGCELDMCHIVMTHQPGPCLLGQLAQCVSGGLLISYQRARQMTHLPGPLMAHKCLLHLKTFHKVIRGFALPFHLQTCQKIFEDIHNPHSKMFLSIHTKINQTKEKTFLPLRSALFQIYLI